MDTYLKELEEMIKNFVEEHSIKGEEYLEKVKKNEVDSIYSKEFLSLNFADEITDDLKMILNSYTYFNHKERYIEYIIRGMTEQIIEYKYLILNENLIKEYLGDKIDICMKFNSSTSIPQLIKFFKKLTGTRYDKKKVFKMAEVLNETVSNINEITLYDIYIIFSEMNHNSYFRSISASSSIVSKENEITQLDIDINSIKINIDFLRVILEKFLTTYLNI